MADMHNVCMTPGQLLEALLNKRGLTSNALAAQLGGGGLQSAMSRLISGKIPRTETIRPVAEFFGVDPSVFQTDKAATDCAIDLGIERGFADAPLYAGVPSQQKRKIPVVGTAKMGTDGFYEEISSIAGAGDGQIDFHSNDKHSYGLKVRGNSMAPAIRDGWYVIVEPGGNPSEGEYVLVKLASGAKMVKEFLYRRPDSIELMSVNGGERMTVELGDLDDMQAVSAVVPPSKWKPE